MKYVGLQTQIDRNNRLSILLLLMFPLIILGTVWLFILLTSMAGFREYNEQGEAVTHIDWQYVNESFMQVLPWVVGIVGVWFIIAYFFNASMIRRATGAHPITRQENPRLYNIVENLCMACNMDMPQVCVVDDPQLNAFASGINKKTYAVTVTTGLMDFLDDEELKGVIGHELTHIRNHDTHLLITSIIFVGIISTIMTMSARMIYYNFIFGNSGRRNSKDKEGSGGGFIALLLITMVLSAIAYFFTLLTRFAISRKREYMADAGGAELSGNPMALASALRKISANPGLDNVKRADVAQLFIMKPDEMKQGFLSSVNSLFSTHPDPQKRIQILEQF